MRSGVEVRLGPGDRERLEAVAGDGNSAQQLVWRARIILTTAEGCGTAEVMRRAGLSKPCVWRWQCRFMEAAVDGRLRDKSRKPDRAPVPDPVVGTFPHAASISSRRAALLPVLVRPPRLTLAPLDYSDGTRPRRAISWRGLAKRDRSPNSAIRVPH